MSLSNTQESRRALHCALEAVKLQSIVPEKQDVVLLEHNQTVADGLKALARNKILSAPLVISPGLEDVESLSPSSYGPSLVAWVDIKDVLKEFLQHFREKEKKIPSGMLLLMMELEQEAPSFTEKMLITLAGSEDRGLIYQADMETSLMTAIRSMFLHPNNPSKVVHRLAIFDSHGTITNIVSQMDVCRYLWSHKELLGDLLDSEVMSLEEVKSCRPLLTLEPHLPTLLAYERMIQEDVSGAPVVSEQGELVANLSVSDLRCIQPEHLSVLALPVAEFLALLHRTVYLGYSLKTSKNAEHPFFASSRRRGPDPDNELDEVRLITCTPEATLGQVLGMLVDHHVHRVYLHSPDAEGVKVLGVVTPTDVLHVVARVGQQTKQNESGGDTGR